MRARFPVLLLLVCVLTTIAIAQQRGTLLIKIVDASGAALPGVKVSITGPARHECITNAVGECTFTALLPGAYRVVSELTGFNSAGSRVSIKDGRSERLELKMVVGALQETVTVKSESAIREGRGRGVAAETPAAPPAPYVGMVSGVGGGVAGYEPWYGHRPANTESYADVGENPFRSVTSEPLSTFSIDVDTASYTNTRRFLNQGSLPPVEAVRIEELINYFHYSYPQPKGDEPFSITTELAECPWNTKHRLALIGLQGRTVDDREVPARNLVFLIDVSGSMMSTDKLPLVQHGLRMLADALRPEDRVSIVVYAGASGLVLPATTGDKKEVIDRAIADLMAGGSTNGGAGIRLAYRIARENFIKKGVNRVILATDGDFNVGVVDQGELVRLIENERESGVFLSVLGVGTGNLKDATMEKLADKGNGNYSYLDSLYEAHRVLVKEAGSTLVTIAKDVKIQVEFNPSAVNAYRLIGYENRILNKEDFNDDRKDAGEIGAGHSVTAIYEIVPSGVDLDRPAVDPLKYTTPSTPPAAQANRKYDGELMTVKLRYKAPDGDVSKLTSILVADRVQALSTNLGFASAVAEAGMLLRNSPHARDASFSSAIARAKKFRGDDPEGYRAEFIRLMDLAATLSKRDRTSR